MRGLTTFILGGLCTLILALGPALAQTPSSTIELAIPGASNRLLIGGGLPFGLYFPMAGTICRLLETAASPQTCAVAPIPDSAAAIDELRGGRLPFALVQSDWLHHAVQGTDRYSETVPATELRSVAAFYTEAFTIFVKATGPIKRLEDLENRRVSVGNPDSYRGILADTSLAMVGLELGDLAESTGEPVVAAIERLCEGQTDAIVAMAAHPADLLVSAGRRCGIIPLPFSDEETTELLAKLPGYAEVVIPSRTYPGQTIPVRTVGLRPVLVTVAQNDPGVVSKMMTAVMRGLSRLNASHPAFSGIGVEELGSAALFAPMHPAAAQALGVVGQ